MLVTISQILAYGGVYSWSWVPAELVLTGALSLILVGYTWNREPLPWHPLFAPVLLFGLLVGAQWAMHLSVYAAATLTGFLQLVAGGAVLYLSYLALQSRKNLQYLSTVLWVFTGCLAGEAIAQYFNAGTLIYWTKDASYATPVGPYLYHNYYAGVLDLLLPVTLAVTFRPINRRIPDRLSIVRRSIIPILAAASLILSQSRGGFFTLIFEFLLAALLFWKDIRASRTALRTIVMSSLVFLACGLAVGWQPLTNRLIHLQYHDTSALNRLIVAKTCIKIWRSHPWTGTGFNTFATVYPAFQAFDNGLQWLQAHNEYAQVLAETGLAGVVLVVTFILLLIYPYRKTMVQRSLSSIEIYQKAAFVGVAGFLFHAYGDFLFHSPGNMMLFFLLVGACISKPNNSSDGPGPSHDSHRAKRSHSSQGNVQLLRNAKVM